MKKIIKDLLKELTGYGYRKFDGVLIEKADSNMGFDKLFHAIDLLLVWQKTILMGLESDRFFDDYFLIEENLPELYENFFRHTPKLGKIFNLQEERISFNENLTKQDIAEIRVFIDENYTPFYHRRVKTNKS